MDTTLSTLFQIQGRTISINDAFQGRRFKTRECKEIEADILKQLRWRPMRTGWVEVEFIFYLSPRRFAVSDVSNLVKILEDCIVKAGYIQDDRKIIKMHLEKRESTNERIEVQISSHKRKRYDKFTK